eukprot:201573-Chlamydomonas_euryale.AAC.1
MHLAAQPGTICGCVTCSTPARAGRSSKDLHPRQVARRSRAACRRSEARVVRPVARPSPEARPVARPPCDDRRKRDPSAAPPMTVGTQH